MNSNNHPLTYVEDDIHISELTPNSMILGRDVRPINSTADGDLDEWTKRQRYVQRCKENAWKTREQEYLEAL